MKRVGIQGIFTEEDLMDLIEIFMRNGAAYGLLSFRDSEFENIEASQFDRKGRILDSTGIWLNTEPFTGQHNSRSLIGHEFKGSFKVSFHGARLRAQEIGESSIGCLTPASGNQLKIWETGLRQFKKRLVRDVHRFSRHFNEGYANEKLNVSRLAIAGYDRKEWALVSPLPGIGGDLIHPIISTRPIPFEI
jgi:hypothetical protein